MTSSGSVHSVREACALILRDDPDAAVVVVHDDIAHALDLIEEIAEAASGPVIAVHGEATREFVEAAAERGLSALTDDLTPKSLQAAIEIAVRRHADAMRRQRTEVAGEIQRLESTQDELLDRLAAERI